MRPSSPQRWCGLRFYIPCASWCWPPRRPSTRQCPNQARMAGNIHKLRIPCLTRFLFLQIDVREAEGLLAVIFYLEFILRVELDLAYRSQGAGAFAILVYIQDNDAKLIVGRAASAIQLAERHGTVRDHHDVQPTVWRWSVPRKAKAAAYESGRSEPADIAGVLHRADESVGPLLLQDAHVVL